MPTALISVSDKRGLVEFARELDELGWLLVASGGTATVIRDAGITVTDVADYTGSPEILGGRVKTLHPRIHAGILARGIQEDQGELSKLGWDKIDIVVVNLYPFSQTVLNRDATYADAIENIDIGGVALIRAAAKNYERVTLVCDPSDYQDVLNELREGGVIANTRKKLAAKGFAHTAEYDWVISGFLGSEEPLRLQAYPVQSLRYGENPHQEAMLYNWTSGDGPLGGTLLQGRELSYTNLLDLDAAWRAAISFDKPTVVIVKHLSPCGIASAEELSTAFPAAVSSDPVSAFGGVIATNRPFTLDVVVLLDDLFVECIVAPGFDKEARNALSEREKCRLLDMPNVSSENRRE